MANLSDNSLSPTVLNVKVMTVFQENIFLRKKSYIPNKVLNVKVMTVFQENIFLRKKSYIPNKALPGKQCLY